MPRERLEVADVFRAYGPAWRRARAGHLSLGQLKVMSAIEACRTAELGGHVARCDGCERLAVNYNSCRNRHCPKCQHQQTQAWLEVQQGLLLSVPYFLLTFTLPAELRLLTSHNQKLIYNLLFRASAQAAQQLARDPRFVGGQIGMVIAVGPLPLVSALTHGSVMSSTSLAATTVSRCARSMSR